MLEEPEQVPVADNILPTRVVPSSPRFEQNRRNMASLVERLRKEESEFAEGGGPKAVEAQHAKGRLTARERIALLLDPETALFELGIHAARGMYEEWGGAPAAGVITGLGEIQGRLFMLIVNDATVKAGAFFPMTAKKVIRGTEHCD
jgi:acetyl-CoA carboxylase carboxyltransferase component